MSVLLRRHPRPAYEKIRELEYDLGFEVRPQAAAMALLKELYRMPPVAAEAAAREIESLTEQSDAAARGRCGA